VRYSPHVKVAIAVVLFACSSPPPAPPAPERPASLADRVRVQQRRVEQFFGAWLPAAFHLEVAPDRAAMTRYAAARWKVPELPCWAVAMGTGSTLLVLDPAVWKTEACDHATDDEAAVDRVIAHELVHVFHGQHRPDDPEFDHADDVGWFVEGLATWGSGQLTPDRERQLAEVLASGGGPTRLADVWTGKARYGAAGSLIRWIEQRFGRARLLQLLDLSTTAAILDNLDMTEEELLAAWRRSI